MKLKHNFCFQALFIFASVVFNVAYADSPPKNQIQLAGQAVRSDRVIVRFESKQQSSSEISQQASLFSELGLKITETIQINKGVTTQSGEKENLVFTILSVDGRKALKAVLQQLNDFPSVLYAEPDFIYHKNIQPNDESFKQLWGLDNQGQEGGTNDADIDAPEAWDTATRSSSIVGIIDTGVDYSHEDLAANIWVNPSEIPDDGIDNDGNGYIDDIHGIDCVNNDSDPMDDESHGTHVAGTIGAVGNNGIGVTGVNWNAKIMALKFLDASGFGDTIDAIECLAYAVKMRNEFGVDIRITNNSWGGGGFSQSMKDAIQASANSNMLFIAAAGNAALNTDDDAHYPSNYDIDNIISIAATNRFDTLASFSNFGATTVDMSAPGEDILSTIPGNQYELFSGTSMAAPHVSGVAALLWSDKPFLTPLEIKYKLMDQGDHIEALEGITVSGRRLNVNSAVNCTSGTPVLNILTPSNQFNLLSGEVLVKARITDCGESMTGIDVLASPNNGDASFALFDNGQGEDTTADDGIYTGIWQLQNPGQEISLTVNADSIGLSTSVTGIALKNIPYKLNAEHRSWLSFEWIDARTGTRLSISDSVDGVETVDIGFDFKFYGVSYSKVTVGSNGMLKFEDNSFFSEYFNTSIPDSTVPNSFIAPYWDDLNPSLSEAANIFTFLEGTAPNRRLTIAWVAVPFYGEDDPFNPIFPDTPVTFEVTLYEGNNDIIFQYDGAYTADSATIGIEHPSGDFGLQYLFNGQNNGEPVQIQNEQAIRIFIEEDTLPGGGVIISPTDDANNRATLGDRLAVSKWEHAFFKYEVDTPQNDIKKATFRVYYEGHNPPLTLFVGGADDDWTEGTATPPVTYIHNNPELQLSSADVSSPGYVEFDVTDYVVDPANADGIVTLEVSNNQDGWNILSSKEGANRPELVIETEIEPPPSITLGTTDDANNLADLDGLLAVSKWEHAFFKFDATDIEQEVSKTTLRVYYKALRAPLTLFVGAVDDDNWTESSGTPLRTFIHDRPELQLASVEGTAAGYVEFDVTGFVADQISNDGIVTLEVSSSIDNWDILSSKEGEFPPELVIEIETQANQPPNAAFSAAPESGAAPLTVLFDAGASNDPDGEIINYEWDFDDGTMATGVSVSHTYNNMGAYTVRLTVTDDKGETDAVEKIVVVDADSNQPELILGYPFEEGSGQSILDLSGNGNNGILEGDATRNPTGKFGEAIEFNGSSSYIKLNSIDITNPSLSIALWFKADDFGTHDARLISKSTGTAESDHYWMVSTIRSGGQQKLRFRLKTDNGGTATLIGNATLISDDWTHVTAIYDGIEMKLFQNGVEVGSLTKSGSISTSSSVETWVGANPGNTRYFDGLIDDVRIYGEALDQTTIEDIMLGNFPLIP